jgi:hypothetical protein
MLLEIEDRRIRTRNTYEDYAKLPDYPRYELIDGEFIVTPSPAEEHQDVSIELSYRLIGLPS